MSGGASSRREFTAILEDPQTQTRLAAEAAEPRNVTPAELRKIIQSDKKMWSEVAKQAGISVK
jgi:tripartite-type tricarboxylate transporter receptor subunit TctC